MKDFFKFLAFMLVAGVIFTSCKDDFTEEDAMEALQKVDLVITVVDASNNYASVKDASVQVVVNQNAVMSTTDTTGVAIIKDVEIGGNTVIKVSKDSYTTVLEEVNTQPMDYRQSQINKVVKIYSTASERMATVKGQLTLESNLVNRGREYVAEGTEVLVVAHLDNGGKQVYQATVGSEGKYEVKVPAENTGSVSYEVIFPTIETTRKIGVNDNDNYSIVETQPVVYYPDSTYAFTSIDVEVPSVEVSVAAPPAQGTGLSLGFSVYFEYLDDQIDEENDLRVLNPGSKYDVSGNGYDTLDFSAGKYGNKAQLVVRVNGNGEITEAYDILDNGAYYVSKPTLNTNSKGGGTGAVIEFPFAVRYNVFISKGGSGYINFPKVSAEYKVYDGDLRLISKSVSDLSNGDDDNDFIGNVSDILGNAQIINGSIECFSGNGDTLLMTKRIASMSNLNALTWSRQAVVYFEAGDVASDSTLSAPTIGDKGYGYDMNNPPALTITNLAYGKNVELKAKVDTKGRISDIIVLNQGTGYVANLNDYVKGEDKGGSAAVIDGNTNITTPLPGGTYVVNCFYGTGVVHSENH